MKDCQIILSTVIFTDYFMCNISLSDIKKKNRIDSFEVRFLNETVIEFINIFWPN